jgi:hypothetical protein
MTRRRVAEDIAGRHVAMNQPACMHVQQRPTDAAQGVPQVLPGARIPSTQTLEGLVSEWHRIPLALAVGLDDSHYVWVLQLLEHVNLPIEASRGERALSLDLDGGHVSGLRVDSAVHLGEAASSRQGEQLVGTRESPFTPMHKGIVAVGHRTVGTGSSLADSTMFAQKQEKTPTTVLCCDGMTSAIHSPAVRTAQHVIALRHTARRGGEVRAELAPVIDDLRDELAPTMSKTQAGAVIGVSVPTLDKWIQRGLLPVHTSPSGRARVLRDPVLDLAERVEDLRRTGETRRLITTVVDRMLREDPKYQREFDELYGPGFAAMRGCARLGSASQQQA